MVKWWHIAVPVLIVLMIVAYFVFIPDFKLSQLNNVTKGVGSGMSSSGLFSSYTSVFEPTPEVTPKPVVNKVKPITPAQKAQTRKNLDNANMEMICNYVFKQNLTKYVRDGYSCLYYNTTIDGEYCDCTKVKVEPSKVVFYRNS